MKIKTIISIASLLITTSFCFSQEFTIQGTVSRNQEPIAEANVYVKGSSEGSITDENGQYQFNLPKGKYTLVFTHGNRKEIELSLTENRIINIDLANQKEVLDEVFLSSLRVDADAPITHSNLGKEEIAERNLGQDIPILMNYLPSVVTTSDAGAGVGYTGIRVRGSDATRVNVTINGVPYNDAESQGTFWVNLGDFASSVESLQLQRGVGTSTNGAGAFGASLNILTDGYSQEPYAEISNSYGSYNTHKHTAKFSTGIFNNHWEFAGRASLIKSDGYIDRASSELKSYFLQGSYVDDNTLIKALTFGGTEQTYQAWYGIDAETMENNRTYNPAGYYEDEEGNPKFYDNQTDNYAQDHYQLLWNQTYDSKWSSNIALHYTYGRGYYEEYEMAASLTDFGLEPFTANGEEITQSDLVGTKWLDNHFYGTTFSLNYQDSAIDAIVGGGWNRYEGNHFGEVIYTRFAQNNDPYEPYYDNDAIKTDFNVYGKITWTITSKLAAYGDLQLRTVNYETEGILSEQTTFNVDDSFTFFNPKAGITYQPNQANQLYFSYARAHREPNRTDYENGSPEPEKLNDFELGWRYKTPKTQINTNLYYMQYEDQLVLTGAIDDVGAFVRENSGNSYRLGIEVDANVQLAKNLFVQPNVAVSQNKNIDFFATNADGELTNYGDTEISFSPSVVAGNSIRYNVFKNLQLNFLSKFVGEQYMGNTEAEGSKLDSYFVSDFNLQYSLTTIPLFKEVVFTGLVNNIFNEKYASNGYYDPAWGAGYYPQAETNFLAGITLKF